jgi:hypothetical protein
MTAQAHSTTSDAASVKTAAAGPGNRADRGARAAKGGPGSRQASARREPQSDQGPSSPGAREDALREQQRAEWMRRAQVTGQGTLVHPLPSTGAGGQR